MSVCLQPESLRYLIQTVNCCALIGDIKVSGVVLVHHLPFTCALCMLEDAVDGYYETPRYTVPSSGA